MQAQRLFDTLEELSTCNATPGNGVTRFSWSEADSRAPVSYTHLDETSFIADIFFIKAVVRNRYVES